MNCEFCGKKINNVNITSLVEKHGLHCFCSDKCRMKHIKNNKMSN